MKESHLSIYNLIKNVCFTPKDIQEHLNWFYSSQELDIIISIPNNIKLPIKFSKTCFPDNIDRFLWYYEDDNDIYFIALLHENIYCLFDAFSEYDHINNYYKPKIHLADTLKNLIKFTISTKLFKLIKNGSLFPKIKKYEIYRDFTQSCSSKESYLDYTADSMY